MRSQAAAGQRKALLSPADEEQQEEEVSTKEEELPRDAVPCQAVFKSGGASRPHDALVHPHLLGVAGVVPGQAPCLPGPCIPRELRVWPPQVGGLAKDLGQFGLFRSPLLRA